jgi:hypothetical protein
LFALIAVFHSSSHLFHPYYTVFEGMSRGNLDPTTLAATTEKVLEGSYGYH